MGLGGGAFGRGGGGNCCLTDVFIWLWLSIDWLAGLWTGGGIKLFGGGTRKFCLEGSYAKDDSLNMGLSSLGECMNEV